MREDASPWLVPASTGKQMTTRQVQYIVEKYSEDTLRPHALRHQYATRILRATHNLIAVRDLLGHSDVSTTQIYTRLDLADMIETAALDPRNKVMGENVVPFERKSDGLAEGNAEEEPRKQGWQHSRKVG